MPDRRRHTTTRIQVTQTRVLAPDSLPNPLCTHFLVCLLDKKELHSLRFGRIMLPCSSVGFCSAAWACRDAGSWYGGAEFSELDGIDGDGELGNARTGEIGSEVFFWTTQFIRVRIYIFIFYIVWLICVMRWDGIYLWCVLPTVSSSVRSMYVCDNGDKDEEVEKSDS